MAAGLVSLNGNIGTAILRTYYLNITVILATIMYTFKNSISNYDS